MSDRQTRVNVSINVRPGSHVIRANVTQNPKSVWWYMIWEKNLRSDFRGKPKNLVFSWISHLHSKHFLGLKRALTFIVVALLKPFGHRKNLLGKRELMSLSVSDMPAMSSVLTWLKTLNRFGDLQFGKKKTPYRILGKNPKNLVFSRISHLHPKLFLGPKRPLTFIVMALFNLFCHGKCHIDKRVLMSLSMCDVAAMSFILT